MDQKKLIELVKKIREETGLGVMEIKSALEEVAGEEKKALEILKTRGAEKAAKKADREVKNGRVFTYVHSTGKLGVVLFQFPQWFYPRENNRQYIIECQENLS